MELVLAQKELMRRCHRWSLQVAEQQARADYPLLRPLFNPNMCRFLAFVDLLDLNQRLLLAPALVKSFYFFAPKEVNIEEVLEDQYASEERHLAEQYLLFMRQFTPTRPPRWAVRENCSPTKAKSLTNAVVGHLSETLRLDFARDEPNDWKGSFWSGDWEISTELSFSGQGIECEFWLVRRDDPQVFVADTYAQFLGRLHHFDLVRCLGVGPTWWIVDCEQDVPAALDSMTAICKQVVSQSPALFSGLGEED